MTKKVKLTIIIALCVVIVAAAVLTTVLLLTNKESEPTLPDNTKQLTKSGHMLAVGGNTEYVILLPADNTSNEYLAANELSDIIFAATGARLEVVNEGKYEVADGAPLISIGNTKLAEECNVRTDNTDLLRSGYFVKTVENRLFVMSDGDGIGLSYAVYDLCEDAVGYRYYAADEIYYEQKPDVDLYVYDNMVMPDIDFRATLYPSTQSDADYRRHLRYFVWDEEYGGLRAHTQTQTIVNYDKYKSQHSFGATKVVDGKTVPDHWFSNKANGQLCWTAGEELERQAASDLYELISSSNSKKFYFHMSQADNSQFCSCDRCNKALSEYAYNYAGLQIAWANNVCKYLKEMLVEGGLGEREVGIVLFAYTQTEMPPMVSDGNGSWKPFSDKVKPCDMIYFEWAPIYTDYSVGYNHIKNEERSTYLQMWKKLFDICGQVNRMSVWTYETNFSYFMYPFNNHGTYADNIKFFSENGINNVFSQGANLTNQPTMQEMRLFVQSQLMWDSSKNYDELANEFMAHYYDEAATAVRKYYDLVRIRYEQAHVLDKADFSTIYADIGSKKVWTEGFVAQVDKIFDEAYAAIEPLKQIKPERYQKLYDRLKEIELTNIYTKLSYYNVNYSQHELDALIDEWKYYVNKYNIKQIAENSPVDVLTMFDIYHS